MSEENIVCIARKELDALREDARVLAALYAGGVEDWEWYGESLSYLTITEDDDE